MSIFFKTLTSVLLCMAALFAACEHEDNDNSMPDKGELRALIASSDEMLELSFDKIAADGNGLADGDWYVTYNDWQTFSGAVDAARAVLRKAATAAEIKAAVAALEAARAAFEAAVVTITIEAEPGALVRFNAPNAVYDGGTLSGLGAGERYLLYPVRVNIMNHSISIQAKVRIIAPGGDNGIGFISVDGSDRKGYMLTTAGGAKNVKTTNGGSSQGFDSGASVSNAAGQVYVFKTEIAGGKIAHYVYNADTGALITKKDTSTNFSAYYGHAAADTVYAAVGGTGVENMEWSEIVVIRNGIKYRIDELHDQTALPVFSVGAAAARVRVDTQESVAYTAKAAGGANAAVTAVSADPSIVRVDDFSDGAITFTGMKTGRTTITVTHADTSFSPRIISVTVTDFPADDRYGQLSAVHPASGAVNVHIDGELAITFDSPPVLDRTIGFIDIYEKTSGALIDTVLFAGEKQRTLGSNNNIINVGAQMVRVEGNGVYITPHFGKLEYGREYYIAIPCEAITADLHGVPFNGLTDDKDAASWSFTTRAAPNLVSPVSVDGSQNSTADFRTLYAALKAIASQSGEWTINVAPGDYTELVRYVSGAANQSITINGHGAVIQYTNNDSMNTGTHLRSSFYFSGANLVLKNITLKNTSTRYQAAPGQAEALFFANGTGRTLAAYNCTFLSHQDTIQTTGKNWFYKCVIRGDTDYIWGQAEVCLLEDCKLVSVNDPYKSEKQAVLLVARTGSTGADAATVGKGYVLFNSEVTTESGMTTYLARNAGGSGFYDQCAVINTRFINQGTGVIGGGLWRQSNLSFLAGAEEHVGFKVYNNTLDGGVFDTAGMPAGSTVMTDALYDAEYSGRDKILNRVYHKSGGYGDSAHFWDIGNLEAGFGAVK
jgi:hypothetical protein